MQNHPMRLHHHPMSTCSLRVRLAARHLGIELDFVTVDLASGAHQAPAFAALNPNRKVPVLEHDGLVLWESYAIMQYLADRTPGQTVYPVEPAARADVNRWLFWCGQSFMPGVAMLNWEHSIKPMIGQGEPDPAAVARGESLFTDAMHILDGQLARGEWLCATGLSLADFAIAAPLVDRQRARLPMDNFSQVNRWLMQMQALAAWQAEQVGSSV